MGAGRWADEVGLAKLRGLAGCLFCAIMTWKGFEMAWAALKYDERMSTPLGTPMVIPYMFIPVGFGVMALYYLLALFKKGKKAESQAGPLEV